MKVFKTINSIQSKLSIIDKKKTLGLVPTMGALHKGHLSIVKRAKKENDHVIVSIFVNPTQFDKEEDLLKYPNTVETDLKLLEDLKCDYVFMPKIEEIYADDVVSDSFDFENLDKVMEGTFRKGHFNGVATIVKKLFNITHPDNAYFGEKDFQQLQIIKKMVEIESIPIQIIACEIYREDNGLAMSSRNLRLSPEQRDAAPLIYKTLLNAIELIYEKDIDFIKNFVEKNIESNEFLELEYFEIADTETLIPATEIIPDKKYRVFIAAFAGAIRLIDNIALN